MKVPQVIIPLSASGLGPWILAALMLAQAPAQAQGMTGNSNPTGPTAVGSIAEPSPTAPGTDPIAAPSTAENAASTGTSAKTPATSRATPASRNTSPRWDELSRAQRLALKPLADAWPSLSELHKRKWLVLSHNFTDLSRQEQDKLQERMSDWANLTARERAQARLHFAEVQQLPGDERRAKWEAYQALSDEQRRKLADDILLEPPRGAAVASRPVAPRKLTQSPASKPDQVLQPRIDTDQIHPKTLLPHFLQGTSTR